MENFPETMRKRIPDDVVPYISKDPPHLHLCIEQPAPVTWGTLKVGRCNVAGFFPATLSARGMVLAFSSKTYYETLAGVPIWRKAGTSYPLPDANIYAETSSICLCIDYPSTLEVGYRQILEDCLGVYEFVRQRCQGEWKNKWGTDPQRIVLTGSSIGATIAIGLAAIVGQKGEPAYGLVAIVPVIDTTPDLSDDPWGQNKGITEYTEGKLLTVGRFLALLKTIYENDSAFGSSWHSNPSLMSDDDVKWLPPTVFVLAGLDILCKSGTKFFDRVQNLGGKIKGITVNGLHQVKDMQATEGGREVKEFVISKLIKFRDGGI